MAKQGSTKSKMLKLISKGENTLSAISASLGLAPSTVSKHLEDLESIGAIEQLESQHIKKWKYYKVVSNSQFLSSSPIKNQVKLLQLPLIAVLLLLFGIIGYLYLQSSASSTYLPISITDPPEVPVGTQALYLNYSSIGLNISYGQGYSWVAINATGRLDLLGLVNQSQVIAAVSLGSKAQISMVRFNVTSSEIEIDNISYPVQITSKQVIAILEGNKVNSSSGLLLDFFPVVSTMYSANNSATFTMVPSLRAIMAPEPYLIAKEGEKNPMSQPTFAFGTQMRYPLPPTFRGLFDKIKTNITISKAIFHSSRNITSLKFTLRNSGAKGIILRGAMLYNENRTQPNFGSAGRNWTSDQNLKFARMNSVGIGFFINQNRSLSLPSFPFEIPSRFGQGYYFEANSTANFTYLNMSGGIPRAPPLIASGSYRIAIISDSGIVAEENVTTT